MTDLNERSFSAGNPSDNAAAQRAATTRSKLAAPLWRFRAGLQPVSVVRTLKTKIIPRLFFALKPEADAAVKQRRRQVGPDYLHLLRFYLNHRPYPRSSRPERTGHSPRELLTGQCHAPWLEMLGLGEPPRN